MADAKEPFAAFPIHPHASERGWGMSLRDYFAGQALAGLVQQYGESHDKSIVSRAFRVADAMLEARKR